MKNLILLFILMILCSCSVKVSNKGTYWICEDSMLGGMSTKTFVYKTLDEANEKCTVFSGDKKKKK